MDLIYFDNNATTFMPSKVKAELQHWSNCGNPSSNNLISKGAVEMMGCFKNYIMQLCRCDPTEWNVIFTSCASESNCTIISSTISSWNEKHGASKIPHIVCSAIEHKSILSHLHHLESKWIISLSVVNPNMSGAICPVELCSNIRDNTALVICMHANNETGIINDVAKIGMLVEKAGVPFHCDVVQIFGKHPTNLDEIRATSISISPHKFGGPTGVGILIVKKAVGMIPLIWGSQNDGLRGGTENVAGIGASFKALKMDLFEREDKNRHLMKLKKRLIWRLSQIRPVVSYPVYVKNCAQITNCIVLMSLPTCKYLDNTLLISIVNKTDAVCNVQIKKELQARGIIIGIGSACNTKSKKASHVLEAMNADRWIKSGTMRISFGDKNKKNEVDRFAQVFDEVLIKCRI